MRHLCPVAFVVALGLSDSASAADPRCASRVAGNQPARGVVPDAKTAGAVALAYLTPIYGEAMVRGEMPLQATLSDDVWMVTGTLPRGSVGGTAHMLICRRNGAVLSIIHSK